MFSRMETGVADHVIETLTFRDRDMEVVHMRAALWERLEEGLRWHFRLRRSVFFHLDDQSGAEPLIGIAT